MFNNLKIAITNEVQLKAVCDVLESMGYENCTTYRGKNIKHIVAFDDYKTFTDYFSLHNCEIDLNETTLTDLLAMRDKQFMEKINA